MKNSCIFDSSDRCSLPDVRRHHRVVQRRLYWRECLVQRSQYRCFPVVCLRQLHRANRRMDTHRRILEQPDVRRQCDDCRRRDSQRRLRRQRWHSGLWRLRRCRYPDRASTVLSHAVDFSMGVSTSSTPEPTSLLLLGTGLAATLIRRRRQN